METLKQEYERIFKVIVNSAYEVHKNLGPGLLESVYEVCMLEELRTQGLNARNQVKLPVYYKGKSWTKFFVLIFLLKIK